MKGLGNDFSAVLLEVRRITALLLLKRALLLKGLVLILQDVVRNP